MRPLICAAALLAARAQARGISFSAALAKTLLCESADGADGGHDPAIGWGVLNVPAALRLADRSGFANETRP